MPQTPTRTPTASPTATRGPSPTPAPASVAIVNPLSDQTTRGTITVQARATNAASVGYRVDAGAETPMVFNTSNGLWQAALDTTRLANGNGHTVDVTNHARDGSTVTDRAWSVNIAN